MLIGHRESNGQWNQRYARKIYDLLAFLSLFELASPRGIIPAESVLLGSGFVRNWTGFLFCIDAQRYRAYLDLIANGFEQRLSREHKKSGAAIFAPKAVAEGSVMGDAGNEPGATRSEGSGRPKSVGGRK